MDNIDDKKLHEEINRATAIKETVNSEGFKYVMAALEEERDSALQELKTVDCTQPNAVVKLQNICWRYDELVIRLGSMMEDGKNAELELTYQGE